MPKKGVIQFMPSIKEGKQPTNIFVPSTVSSNHILGKQMTGFWMKAAHNCKAEVKHMENMSYPKKSASKTKKTKTIASRADINSKVTFSFRD